MGLSNKNSNATFVSTFDGSFRVKLKGPQPGSVQRVNKNGDTVNEMCFNSLTGTISKIEYKVTEKYGDFWSISIADDQMYKLDLPVSSSSTFYFLNRLISDKLNVNEPIELKVFADVENDVKKTVILIYQGGEMIKGVYSKDEPGDLPAMKKIKFKGKETWDSTERDQYLRDYIEAHLIPEIKGATPTGGSEPEHVGDGPSDDDGALPWDKE